MKVCYYCEDPYKPADYQRLGQTWHKHHLKQWLNMQRYYQGKFIFKASLNQEHLQVFSQIIEGVKQNIYFTVEKLAKITRLTTTRISKIIVELHEQKYLIYHPKKPKKYVLLKTIEQLEKEIK